MYRYLSLSFLPSWMPSAQLNALRCFPTLLDSSCGVRGLLLLLLLLRTVPSVLFEQTVSRARNVEWRERWIDGPSQPEQRAESAEHSVFV